MQEVLDNNKLILQDLRDTCRFMEMDKITVLHSDYKTNPDKQLVTLTCEIIDKKTKDILFQLLDCDTVYDIKEHGEFWELNTKRISENIRVVRDNIKHEISNGKELEMVTTATIEKNHISTVIKKYSTQEFIQTINLAKLITELKYIIDCVKLCKEEEIRLSVLS